MARNMVSGSSFRRWRMPATGPREPPSTGAPRATGLDSEQQGYGLISFEESAPACTVKCSSREVVGLAGSWLARSGGEHVSGKDRRSHQRGTPMFTIVRRYRLTCGAVSTVTQRVQ